MAVRRTYLAVTHDQEAEDDLGRAIEKFDPAKARSGVWLLHAEETLDQRGSR